MSLQTGSGGPAQLLAWLRPPCDPALLVGAAIGEDAPGGPGASQRKCAWWCDAQASGGLLVAVARDLVGALKGALARRGVVAAQVAEVLSPGQGRAQVVP